MAKVRETSKPDKEIVNYALNLNMGEGYQRRSVELSVLGSTFNMLYGEWRFLGESSGEAPLVLCVHGTPATEGAFRPIASLIAEKGYRVLAVNFPGNGYTEMDSRRVYDCSTDHKVALVKAFIFALNLSSIAMVIGHSTGCIVMASLVCDPEVDGIIQSICAICETGILPYKGQREACLIPYLPYILFRAAFLPYIGPIITFFFARLVHWMGFRGRTPQAQVMSILEGYLIDFKQYKTNLSQVGKSGIPYLYMFALDDTIIQPGMKPTSMDALGVAEQDIRDDPEVSCLSDEQFQDTTLHRVIRFTRGSHRLQFTRPETVMKEIVSLLSALKKK